MASRKDNKGRVLKPRESQRKDGRYLYTYYNFLGTRCYVYASDLATLREKEKKLQIEEWTGIDSKLGDILTLNNLYDRYIQTKYGLRSSTYASYMQIIYQESRGFPNCTIDGYTDFIFTKSNGTVYTSSRLNKVLCDVVKCYNEEELILAEVEDREPVLLPKISNHILRHTFCTRLCERDVNIKVIQTIMGHANIKITMDIYAEVSEEKQRIEMEKIASELDVFW